MQHSIPDQSDLSVAANMNYLTSDNTVFTKTEGHMLMVQVNDDTYEAVYLHCSFPHNNRRVYISVRTSENKEIGIIRSLDEDFPKDIVCLLEEQIKMRYFAPEITKLVGIKEEFGYSYWDTETVSGSCRFTVRSGGGNVKLVTDRKLLIIDVYGNRFVIEDIKRLSEKEYRLVEMYI